MLLHLLPRSTSLIRDPVISCSTVTALVLINVLARLLAMLNTDDVYN